MVVDLEQQQLGTRRPDYNKVNHHAVQRNDPVQSKLQLLLGGELILNASKDGIRTPFYDNEGRLLYWVVDLEQTRTDFEKNVYYSGRCRPSCIWTSIKVIRVENLWVEEYPEIFDDHIVQHYKRKVWERWGNCHCENGRWVRKNEVDDNFVARRPVRKRTLQEM